MPKSLPGDLFYCSRMIRCRLPGEVAIKLFKWVHPSSLSFMISGRTLKHHHGSYDSCLSCAQYRKYIEFTVRDLEQPISICAKGAKRLPRKTSAFPQSIQWFINQQSLNTPFRTPYHRSVHHQGCNLCSLITNEHPLSLSRNEKPPTDD